MNKLAIDIGSKFGSPWGVTYSLGTLISSVVTFSFTLAGIILLFMMVGGGIAMISGAGDNDPRKAAQGKEAVTGAIVGFAVVFMAYWIIRIIELIAGVPFITDPGI